MKSYFIIAVPKRGFLLLNITLECALEWGIKKEGTTAECGRVGESMGIGVKTEDKTGNKFWSWFIEKQLWEATSSITMLSRQRSWHLLPIKGQEECRKETDPLSMFTQKYISIFVCDSHVSMHWIMFTPRKMCSESLWNDCKSFRRSI